MSDLVIYKHNDLIDNFVFNATELELQILNYAVAVTNPEWDNQNLVYTINIPELVAVFKTNSKSAYKDYREALSRLMKREYSYYGEKGNIVTENLITRTVRNENDTSWLQFRFNDYISQRITNLKELFTRYDIKHIAQFKSRYAFMLYEFFKMNLEQQRKSSDGKHFHKEFNLDELKEKLGIEGKYTRFFHFESRILEVAKNNINKHSDIRINYKVKRKGRTPTHIVFNAQYKKGHEPDSIDSKQQIDWVDEQEKEDSQQEKQVEFTDQQRQLGKQRINEIKDKLGLK